ncbi:SRPBCC domain-containing protein [Kitasatospora sp. NPDC018058]|uniref:SRPBCC domain-containing protein n=1 Tax=Kitasatospora sp. NPDC018058 TaxID=3364025 RepID=UPI0037BE8BFF
MAKPETTAEYVAALTGGPLGSDLGELTVTRVFNAPREMVFRAFIEPEQFVRFWSPAGTTVTPSSVTIEPWAGGRFESTTVADADATEYPMKYVFLAVVEPELLSYTDSVSGIDSSMVFTDLGDGRTRTSLFHSRRRSSLDQ